MFGRTKTLGLTALLLGLSGLLHIVAPFVSGFSSEGLTLVPFGLAWLLIALGLLRGMRWLAWVAFFAAISLGIVAMSSAFGFSDVPGWLYGTIAVADGLAAVTLFGHLWFPRESMKLVEVKHTKLGALGDD